MVKVLENVFRGIICSFALNNWSNLWRMMFALFPAAIFVLLGGGYSNECTSWLFSQDASECLEQKGIEEIMLFSRSREFWPALTTVNPHTRYPTNTRDFQPVTISQTLFSSSIFPPRSTIWTRGTVHSDHDVATDVRRKRKIQYVCCKLKRGRWARTECAVSPWFFLKFCFFGHFRVPKILTFKTASLTQPTFEMTPGFKPFTCY